MPRFAANLTMMFNEVPFLDRFEAAARAGFQAVEFLFPYPYPAAEIRSRLALDDVESDNIFLQYDMYHAQRTEGELAATIERHLPRIAHMQLADNPGRHEPGTGEINYDFLFRHIDRLDYDGWIGCEYKPATTTEAGLGWLDRYLEKDRMTA